MLDYVLFSLKSLFLHKLRTFLNLSGISIGIMALVAIYSLSLATKQEIEGELSQLGGSELYYLDSKYSQKSSEDSDDYDYYYNSRVITRQELKQLAKIKEIGILSLMVHLEKDVKCGSMVQSGTIMGVSPEYLTKMTKKKLIAGRFLTGIDDCTANRCCLITQKGLKALKQNEGLLNRTVSIGGSSFTVIGIIQSEVKNSKLVQSNIELEAFIPLSTAQKMAGEDSSVPVFTLRDDISDKNAVVTRIINDLTARCSYKYDYKITSMSEVFKKVNNVMNIVTAVIGAIGALSLLVGGIGVMNIMLVSVVERTREIGIRVAVGARTRDLLFQFMIESMTVCMFGGILGILMGVLLIFGLSYVPHVPVAYSVNSIFIGLAFSAVTGLIFGIYPAFKASRLDPIECLRYE
ncbi:MAG: ABC transporter permease [Candidatus Wallbacteria bacterium]|nr:ABC transporter permease [Candidatus Wallbacteria bacterium]